MYNKKTNTEKEAFGDRKDRQESEGYATVKTDMPAGRLPEAKQVLTPDQLGGATSPVTGTSGAETHAACAKSAATKVKSKMKIAPDATVDVLEGKQVGGVPLEITVSNRSVAGFSAISSADDMSKTSYSSGKYRPDSRYGKKRSDDLFEIDNTITEQIAPVVEDSLDLKEAPDAGQGYNGRKQFTQSRAKKNVAGLPQVLLQEASVDFVFDNAVLHTTGQVLDGVDAAADYPTKKADGSAITDVMNKGNYELNKLVIDCEKGHITSVHFEETKYEVPTDPVTRDQANMNWQVDANRVAKSMIKLQTELGRETTEKWSPLGYVINQPYQYNMLYHDIESVTGAMMATAYRAAVSSLSFQRNILAKDGIAPQSSAIKMFVEDFAGDFASSDIIPNGSLSTYVFNRSLYRQGSAAALIDMFDSTPKYHSKADILGMQRSLPLHLSQCDNNINPLHVKPEFMKVLNKAHLFSTPTGNYNPLLPIYATRKITLINPMSLNYFLKGWTNPALASDILKKNKLYDNETGTVAQYSYSYADVRNTYFTKVQHPVVEGILRWLLKHEGAFISTFAGSETSEIEVIIPCDFDFTNPGLFEFMLCSASQDIAWERNICFRDILFAGEQSAYIWNDLESLHDIDPLHSTQLTISGYNEPLKLGKMAPDVQLRTFWNDSFTFMGRSNAVAGTDKYVYALPWYVNERSLSKNSDLYTAKEGFWNEPTAFNMTIPSIRDGIRHEYVDIIKSMSEEDVRLAMDRMIGLPLFIDSEVLNNVTYVYPDTASSTINANIKVGALRYDANSDGRVIIQYDLSHRQLSEISLYCVAKELGWIWPGHADDIKIITEITLDHGDPNFTYVSNDGRNESMDGSRATRLCSYRVKADSMTDGSIDRSAALTQVFYQCFALRDAAEVNATYTCKTGIAPSLSYNDGVAETPNCIYNIDSVNLSSALIITSLNTQSRVTWTKLQRVFFPINPFENCYILDTNAKGVKYDPLESAFDFGVCGTLASDYTQCVLERLDIRDQFGIDYTEDEFAKKSLILRAD